MASKNDQQPMLSVEERLKALYELQTILTEIDRIKTVRGELPLEVKDLMDSVAGLHQRVENANAEIERQRKLIAATKIKIQEAQALIEKYNNDINNVSNNREYDLLSKEIEYQNLEIELCQKHLHEYETKMAESQNLINVTQQSIEDQKHILEEKEAELDEIVSETRQEEEALKAKALTIEPRIDDFTLRAFKRIRNNSRNGLGIVYVQRNACGGCFNRIPPQRQMEIKMHKKVIVCEYCGRIIIDPELAGIVE